MVKRIVDTSFWTDMQVIDNYSVEDKFFYLYLLTNDKTTQVGIYPLPKKVMSFETGFTTDVIQVLLDRFSENYEKIIYSEKTQEITLLDSLEFSVLTGGKPVSDLLDRELTKIRDDDLIRETYKYMKSFWETSKRKFDQTIMKLFEDEMTSRGILHKQNQNQEQNQGHSHFHNQSHNHNHNQDSYSTSRKKTLKDKNEDRLLEHYTKLIKRNSIYLDKDITSENILNEFYTELIGELSPAITAYFETWEQEFPKSIILEALNRSIKAQIPISYAKKIIEDWKKNEVKEYQDIIELDRKFNRKY